MAVWIARDNPAAAEAFQAAALQGARLISEHPEIGQIRWDIASDRFRFLVLRGFPHVLVYEPNAAPPRILRVLHGARDLGAVLSGLRG